jgi:uncharacterized protein (TIGR02266 family)
MVLQMKVVEKRNEHVDSGENTPQKKVLLVDDITLFIEIEKSVLARLDNFQTLTAHSGIEALRIIEEERPDLVFMDMYMDNMDGDECCRIIKEKYGASIAVVMVTHGSAVDDFERCWNSGCDEIIVKPINHHLFIATAKKYLKLQPRSDTRLSAHLKVKHGIDQQTTLSDYSVNLSTGGLFLATTEVLPVDTKFAIEFILPGRTEPIGCQARVAWVNKPPHLTKKEMPLGMGLQFVDVSLSDVDAIREYLSGGRLIPSW